MELTDKALVVLDAASRVFLEHGFSAATTDMIQREAGVSKSTVYAHYPNKDALFVAVIERECLNMTEHFRAMEPRETTLHTRFTELGMAYLQIVLSPKGLALFRVAAAESPRFPAVGQRFHATGPKVVNEVMAKHVARAVEQGELNVQAVGVDAAATLFVSLLRGEGHMECIAYPDSLPSAARLEQWVRLAVTTFLLAFAAKRNEQGA